MAPCWRVAGWCGAFWGCVFWLDPRSAFLALVFWCSVVRPAASCRDLPCCVVFVLAVLRCALLGRVEWGCVVPWCAALCRVPSGRAVVCCALGRLVVVRCTVVRCGAVCRAAPCSAVVGWCRSVRPVSWCGVRVGVWLAGGPGVRLGAGWLGGSVLWGSGCAAWAGGSVRCPWGFLPWGPLLWSRVLWGSWPHALAAVAAPSSSSGVCEVALAVAGVVAWQ